jgi:large subunit ribosomal protein L18
MKSFRKLSLRDKRSARVRRHLKAVNNGRPRLSVFRSGRHIYAQLIDDAHGHTLAAASTVEETARKSGSGANVSAAEGVGTRIAERAKEQGVSKVVFDRGGYLFHGRVKALAEAARAAGLEF